MTAHSLSRAAAPAPAAASAVAGCHDQAAAQHPSDSAATGSQACISAAQPAVHASISSTTPPLNVTADCASLIQQARHATTAPATSIYRDHRVELGDFRLSNGRQLADVQLSLRWYGQGVGPVFVVLGGISAHRILCDDTSQRGWWSNLVGPGRALDTRYCQVIGVDFLASGESSKPRQLDDWALSPADQAQAIVNALRQLEVPRLAGVIGASYGGMVALHWAQRFPSTLQRLLVICAAHRSSVQTSAYRALQRQIVRFGAAQGDPAGGLQLARSLAMLGFRSAQEFEQRFSATGEFHGQRYVLPVEDYLGARGADYIKHHTAASFVCLSQSCDLHRLNPASVASELWLAAAPNDQIVPYQDVLELAENAPQVRFFQRLDSIYGHDCFLKEHEPLSRLLTQFRLASEDAPHRDDACELAAEDCA